jgi:hypothetical protein
MMQYTIKKGIIPIAQVKRTPAWKTAASWALAGMAALVLIGFGLQRIS